MFKLTRHWKNN